MNLAIFPILMLGVLLNAGAQLLLKAGVQRIENFDLSFNNLFNLGLQISMNPYIVLGIAAYVISVGVWLVVLSRVDVSIAYPMVSLGYVVNAFAAYYLFDEAVTVMRMSGIFVILLGVFLVARS